MMETTLFQNGSTRNEKKKNLNILIVAVIASPSFNIIIHYLLRFFLSSSSAGSFVFISLLCIFQLLLDSRTKIKILKPIRRTFTFNEFEKMNHKNVFGSLVNIKHKYGSIIKIFRLVGICVLLQLWAVNCELWVVSCELRTVSKWMVAENVNALMLNCISNWLPYGIRHTKPYSRLFLFSGLFVSSRANDSSCVSTVSVIFLLLLLVLSFW